MGSVVCHGKATPSSPSSCPHQGSAWNVNGNKCLASLWLASCKKLTGSWNHPKREVIIRNWHEAPGNQQIRDCHPWDSHQRCYNLNHFLPWQWKSLEQLITWKPGHFSPNHRSCQLPVTSSCKSPFCSNLVLVVLTVDMFLSLFILFQEL